MNPVLFMEKLITFLIIHKFITILSTAFILYLISRGIKFIIYRRSYDYLKRLLKKNLYKGLKKVSNLKDINIKKRLILEGKNSLGKNTYNQVKDELLVNGFIDELFNEIISEKDESKIEACKTLVELNTPQSIDYAIIALYDNDEEVKKEVIEALTTKANPKIIETLINYLEYCDNTLLLEILSNAFKNIGIQAFEQLVEVTFTKKQVYRSWAIKILASFDYNIQNRNKAIEIFIKLLNDSSEIVRIHTIKALTKFKNNKLIFNNLINKLNDSSCKVRSQAAKSLGEYQIKKAAPFLFNLITDSSGIVRSNAYQALVELEEEGLKYIIKATESVKTKEEALNVLKKLDVEKLVVGINKIYNNSEISNKVNFEEVEKFLTKEDNKSNLGERKLEIIS
ncbi:HEAT repeat domain-containing protein [Orenia marismortui]|uniref:HEAT repeat protein n=1 Tax=Orenia marismortui TaxID=46469 RepID=A0A4R8GYR8_9FIRM|nr:HEAT repeat domain-containing protein [Orenia marismortui]TDX51677.1 HEAT repeat protein [Orenia marismortui]